VISKVLKEYPTDEEGISLEISVKATTSTTVLDVIFVFSRQAKQLTPAEPYLISIYLLTAIGLPPGGSSTVHIYTQTIHITKELTTLVGRLSGIRTHIGQNKINDELTA
jgi:hypothetical protein